MKVLFDGRVFSTGASRRGMGRYSAQLLRALATDHELHLMLFDSPDREAIRALVEYTSGTFKLRSRPEVATWQLSQSITLEIEEALASTGCDAICDATPFIGPFRLDLPTTRSLAVLYDLIPLHHPEDYLPTGSAQRSQYPLAARIVRRADDVLAISKTVALDGQIALGIPPERIHVMYPDLDPEFRDLCTAVQPSLQRSGILLISGTHKSKGLRPFLDGLQDARRMGLSTSVDLVLPSDHARREIALWPKSLLEGVRVHIDISEHRKVELLSTAALFVHPSLEEGYGLPMVEALRLGTPVLACESRLSRELGGEDITYYKANSIEAVSAALLEWEVEFRSAQAPVSVRPLDLRSEPFKWSVNSVANPGGTGLTPKVAVIGPYPPRQCGIADYTEDFVRGLASAGIAVTAVSCDPQDVVPSIADEDVARLAPLDGLRVDEFDAVFMQLGMASWFSPLVSAIADGRLRDGRLVVHDRNMTVGMIDVWESDLWHRSIVTDVLLPEITGKSPLEPVGILASALETDPVDWRESVSSQASLSWATSRVARTYDHVSERSVLTATQAPEVSARLDMIVGDPYQSLSLFSESPSELHVSDSEGQLVFGVFGNVVPTKRLGSVLTGISFLRMLGLQARLEIVGSCLSATYRASLDRLVEELDLRSAVEFHEYLSPPMVLDRMAVWSAGIVLRDPVAMGMSAALVRMLAAGVPVVMSDVPDWGHVRGPAVFRVPTDSSELREGAWVAMSLMHIWRAGQEGDDLANLARATYLARHQPLGIGKQLGVEVVVKAGG